MEKTSVFVTYFVDEDGLRSDSITIEGSAGQSFQFLPSILRGQLLDDFLRDFNILPNWWAQKRILRYQTAVDNVQLAKWNKKMKSA